MQKELTEEQSEELELALEKAKKRWLSSRPMTRSASTGSARQSPGQWPTRKHS